MILDGYGILVVMDIIGTFMGYSCYIFMFCIHGCHLDKIMDMNGILPGYFDPFFSHKQWVKHWNMLETYRTLALISGLDGEKNL